MPELHLKQPGFTYSACGPFTKHNKEIQKFRETDNIKNLYRTELEKACFVHDAVYPDSKDLARRTISGKILKDRAYEIALASVAYKFFDKKTKSGISVNEQLAEELHKPVIKNLKEKKVYIRFKDSIWAGDLAENGSLSSKN